jgi:hypothetical protein
MLNRSALNAIRHGLIALYDESTGGCRNGQFPFEILRSDGIPRRMLYATQQRTCVAEYLMRCCRRVTSARY